MIFYKKIIFKNIYLNTFYINIGYNSDEGPLRSPLRAPVDAVYRLCRYTFNRSRLKWCIFKFRFYSIPKYEIRNKMIDLRKYVHR